MTAKPAMLIAAPMEGARDMARRRYQDPPLRKTRTHRPKWFITIRKDAITFDGSARAITRHQERVYFGYCDEIGRREAERRRNAELKGLNHEVYRLQSHIRFEEFVGIYREQHLPTLGAGTQRKYSSHLDAHLLPAFGTLKLADIDTAAIDRFLLAKSQPRQVGEEIKPGLGSSTRQDLKNLLGSIFSKAADWGYWTERSPVERASVGKARPVREKRILDMDATRRLLATLRDDVRLIVMATAYTGCRISEVLGLQWKHVDLVRGVARISQRWSRGDLDVTKTGSSVRELPLGYLADELRPLARDPERFVFARPEGGAVDVYDNQGRLVGQGEPWDDRVLMNRHLRPAARALGLYFPGFGFHSFRRAVITRLQEVGASAVEAQIHGGHTRPAMTSRYTVLQPARHEELVRRMQEQLTGKPEGGIQ